MRLTSEPVHPASVFLSETNREVWRKGQVFISPRLCCSPQCLCSSHVGGVLSDSKTSDPLPVVCLSWKSRPASLIQCVRFRITCCSSMNELQRNLGDWQRTEILVRAKTLSVIYDWAWLPPRFISDSSNCSYNLDDVLPEYRRFAFRTHVPGTSHVVLPGPYLFAVLSVNTHQLTQTDCQPELKRSQTVCACVRACVPMDSSHVTGWCMTPKAF